MRRLVGLLDVLLPARCPVCHQPGGAPCPACAEALPPPPALPPPVGTDSCLAVAAYEGAGRELVAALKFRGEHQVARWAAARLALRLSPGFDVVTWVPTTPRHRRRRGADQAEVLARAVGRAARLPVRPLLRRLPGPPQAGLGRRARLHGPRLAAIGSTVPAAVLLVDDVVTTGGSVAAAARALRAAGAGRVGVAALARTPR